MISFIRSLSCDPYSLFVCCCIWLLAPLHVRSFAFKTNRNYCLLRFEALMHHSNSAANEVDTDYVGAGTLGDIMSDEDLKQMDHGAANADVSALLSYTESTSQNTLPVESLHLSPTKSGLVTQAGGTLQAQFGAKITNLSPLDRIALTSNGNLQRIFSSYYDAPVHVHVDYCVQRQPHQNSHDGTISSSDVVWDRKVRLIVFDQVFCTATSVISVHSPDCVEIVKSGKVGLGQLFRFLDKLPTFTILDAGTTDSGGLWRKYKLECTELTCDILEEFVPNAWELKNES